MLITEVTEEQHEAATRWRSLLPFARGEEVEILERLLATFDLDLVAEALGLSSARLRGRLSSLERAAGRRGWHPGAALPEEITPGFSIKRTSLYYGKPKDDHGKPIEDAPIERRGGWVISEPDKEHKVAALVDAVRADLSDCRGVIAPIAPPRSFDVDCLSVYPIGDLHLGMYAWAEEAGEDFDLDICRGMILGSMQRLIDRASPSRRAIVCNLGDWYHSDTPLGVTGRSGHHLDTDGRWAKVYTTGVMIQRELVEMALRRHEHVELINLIGNHDDVTAVTLSVAMNEAFRNEPRVEVCMSPAQHRFREHGSVLLGFHHGHETNTGKLAGVMTSRQRQAWGRTLFAHWYCGHFHSRRLHEDGGVTVEYFRNPSPNDAWAAGQGYSALRDLRVDTWHKVEGLRSQVTERALRRAA